MISTIIVEWLKDFDALMKVEKRQFLQFLNVQFANVQLYFIMKLYTRHSTFRSGLYQKFQWILWSTYWRKNHQMWKRKYVITVHNLIKFINVVNSVYFIRTDCFKITSENHKKLCKAEFKPEKIVTNNRKRFRKCQYRFHVFICVV